MKKFFKVFWPFHSHLWKCVGVNHYVDKSYGQHASGTKATYLCTVCKKTKLKNLWGVGHLSVKQLNGDV